MPEQTPATSSVESVEEKPCSSTATADGGSDVVDEAKKLLGTGNRHLVMGDVVSAVAVFQEACGLLADKFGDLAYECAEANFLCGKSLLELARMENTVLGNALDGVPEDEDDEVEEEQPNNSNIESANNLDDDDDDDNDEDAQEEKNGEEEEVGNLQLAWEMLEVAKAIYKRRDTREDQLMVAQAHLKLGEVSAESGNYHQALEDFQECLTLQLKHLSPDSRLLAETHYQIATTFCYIEKYSQAIQHYSSAIQVIESKLARLQEAIDKASGVGCESEKSEVEELKDLLPQLREKLEDSKEGQRTASAASKAIQQTLGGASTSQVSSQNGASSSSFDASQISVKPSGGASSSASDISHLVRKKRKPEDDSAIEDSETKRAKQEVNRNGDSSASNGKEASQVVCRMSGGSPVVIASFFCYSAISHPKNVFVILKAMIKIQGSF